MENIIDGKKLAYSHEEKLKEKISKLGRKLNVVSILIGEDPASLMYSNLKKKKASELGINFEIKNFPENEQFENVVTLIYELNKNPEISGIMVQLPVPENFLKEKPLKEFLDLIDPKKDIDGLTSKSLYLPAVVRAVLSILKDEQIAVKDKNVVVIGAGELAGKPIARELAILGGRVEICDINTPDIKEKTLNADILVSAAGSPSLIKGDFVKEGVVVIDVGTSKKGDKILGDVDFEEVSKKASKITPSPGGVGPMTVISLMENILNPSLG